MSERLKNLYGPEIPTRVAAMIVEAYPPFAVDEFIAECLAGYEELELTARARHMAAALAHHLPPDFKEAAQILVASLGPPIAGDELTGQGMAPFVYLPHVFYVAEHGLDHWDVAMETQYELTQRFTCEFSIRAFIDREPTKTMARLQEWALDPSPHVRRLVSEGTRPRLPWAPRLRCFVADPLPVIELLELLKDDPTTLVRRSVANNLNDIGKDHPDLLADVCRRWMVAANPERKALIRHALRSAVKRGEAEALEVLGFGGASQTTITEVAITPSPLTIGERVRISFRLTNRGSRQALYNVDLKINFVKANGATSPKVFKVKAMELDQGASTDLSKSISLAQHTTRTHNPGKHEVEAMVNGATFALGEFDLIARTK